MRLPRHIAAALMAAALVTPAATQQYIPNIAVRNSCWSDPRLLRQAYVAALATVRRLRMNEGDFNKHVSGCDARDLIYYRKVAAQ